MATRAVFPAVASPRLGRATRVSFGSAGAHVVSAPLRQPRLTRNSTCGQWWRRRQRALVSCDARDGQERLHVGDDLRTTMTTRGTRARRGDGKGVHADRSALVPGGGGVAMAIAWSAALAMMLGTAPAARAFVPIRGCGEPGSPYDTRVYDDEHGFFDEVKNDPSGDASSESGEGTRGWPSWRARGTAGCTKLYQPARAAELRAVAAAKQAAQASGGRSTTGE